MTKVQKWLLRISIAVNVVLGFLYFVEYTAYSYKLGMLKKDIKIGLLNNKDSTYFILPKGITVRDVSERGISAIGQFENNRFDIIITTDNDSLVNYEIDEKKLLPFGNYYSADAVKYK